MVTKAQTRERKRRWRAEHRAETAEYLRTWHSKHPFDFGASDVECPVCGTMDNHCDHRRGLCLECYCSLANRVGESAVAAMDAAIIRREAERAAMDAAIIRREAERAVVDAMRRGTFPANQRNWRGATRLAKYHGIDISRKLDIDKRRLTR